MQIDPKKELETLEEGLGKLSSYFDNNRDNKEFMSFIKEHDLENRVAELAQKIQNTKGNL